MDRSCDNLLFRCRLAVEMGAGSDWNCICLSEGLRVGYSAFTPIPLKEQAERAICGANLCFALHSTLCYGSFFVFQYLITVKEG